MRRATLTVLGLIAAPAAGAAQASGVDTAALLRLTLGLALVLALIVGLAWAMRRFGGMGGNAGGRLQVLGAASVGQRERVVLVQVGEQQLLLGVAPGSVRTLHVLEEPLMTPSAGGQAQPGFAGRLRGVMSQSGST